jgi:Nup133 N terminal like
VPLEAAGRAVLAALREDEAAPDADLYRRLSHSGRGSHLYFSSQSSSSSTATTRTTTGLAPVLRMQHLRSVPLPPLLSQQLSTSTSHSFMGLLGEAGLAWMTVDDKLFLWSIQHQTVGSFCSFQVPSGQFIVSVGLVRPKRGRKKKKKKEHVLHQWTHFLLQFEFFCLSLTINRLLCRMWRLDQASLRNRCHGVWSWRPPTRSSSVLWRERTVRPMDPVGWITAIQVCDWCPPPLHSPPMESAC